MVAKTITTPGTKIVYIQKLKFQPALQCQPFSRSVFEISLNLPGTAKFLIFKINFDNFIEPTWYAPLANHDSNAEKGERNFLLKQY